VATIFTKIIRGEVPGRFVWRDERCVAFLSINPLKPGHTLVVPIEEVDHWLDLELGLVQHLTGVSQCIGKALDAAYRPEKVGLMLAGLEVPHVHLHVVPISGVRDLDFSNAARNPDPADLDAAADTIRQALRELGYEQVVDSA
jgi:histidine triad (HIT) family protein